MKKEKKIKFIVTENMSGGKTVTDIFTDIILSEMKEKVWQSEQPCGIINPPTIPKQVRSKTLSQKRSERSSHGTNGI